MPRLVAVKPHALSMTAREFVAASGGAPAALSAYRAFHRRGECGEAGSAGAPSAPGAVVHDEETVKFTLGVGGGLETESVIIPMPHRRGRFSRTLCVSSQVGCAMGCTFCETAQMGLMRNLSPAEIVQQLWVARFGLGPGAASIDISNIVFMGMGEPTDNLDAVLQAVEVMCDSNGCAIASSRVAISTVGRVAGIARIGEFIQKPGFRRLGLALSLNAPNDGIRSQIMPVNRADNMAALRQALQDFPMRRTAAICVEYVLIPGVNNLPEHCDEACAWLRGIRCSLNVIPYNPRRNSPWRAPTEDEINAFIARAVANGQFTKRRMTKGRTAMAACGQLGNEGIRKRKLVALGASVRSPGCPPEQSR